ncbi:MAG TPA: Asp-tRNA(Asn)/Glu-tRNA(Gln) amidotransferase subunit GatC [Pseudomonadales bacterium]|nr:Asp-tRNA(Asn)/Glu-tRNA(Gln) amidotransferase subunit GatC [Pseudomonadales bacterium]
MSLTRQDVEKIAHLARLAITEEELASTTERLSNILNLVDQLQAAQTDGIEPMAHPLDVCQRLRPDAVTETNQREKYQQIAPATEAGLYLVPKVIE